MLTHKMGSISKLSTNYAVKIKISAEPGLKPEAAGQESRLLTTVLCLPCFRLLVAEQSLIKPISYKF